MISLKRLGWKMLIKFIPQKNWRILKWKLFGKRIDRNAWCIKGGHSWEIYKKLMIWSWEETKKNAPQYFNRLEFTVRHCHGKVLEIGSGIGNMTRWIGQVEGVKEIIAIDSFPEAIKELKTYNIPKVEALHMQGENIHFNDMRNFDTVVMCELIEHIYPDEERKILYALRRYINSETAYIVSTPIGFMDDSHHVRGFSKKKFINHLKKYYGDPLEVDYSSGYSQVAFGYFRAPDKKRKI